MSKKVAKSSITVKYFSMIFLLIVLTIIAFFLFTRSNTIEASLAQKKISDLATLEALASNIHSHMSAVEVAGHFLSQDKDIVDFFEAANAVAKRDGPLSYRNFNSAEVLASKKSLPASVIAVSCFNPRGIPIGEQTLSRNRLTYFFHPTLMREIRENGDAQWTKTFSIESVAEHIVTRVFAFVVPVTNTDDKLLGYLTLFLDINSMSPFLEPYKEDLYILENSVILLSKKGILTNTSLFSELKFSYSLLLEDSSVIVRTRDDSLIVTTKEFTPLEIKLLSTSSHNDFSSAIATGLPSLLTFLLYGIIFAFVASLLIARLQAKPIRQMQNLMNKVKQGDFSLRLKITSKDEFGELGLTLNSLLNRIQTSMAEQKRHQQVQQKMELQMIQEQIKPHFLYNVLEITSSMIRCNLNSEALATVEHLANFYRVSLSHGSDIISVSQEIQLTENYLSLQKTRYIEFMDYVLAISPAIYQYKIPKLTLQPLIENAIYHGVKEKETGGFLCVSGYLENKRVVFEVFDTGNGIAPDKIKDLIALSKNNSASKDTIPHFGVGSIIRRLNILYSGDVTFNIDSTKGEYTCITLSFPANNHSD